MSHVYRKSYTHLYEMRMVRPVDYGRAMSPYADVCGQLDAFFEHTPACTVYHNILCGRNIPLCPVSLSLR